MITTLILTIVLVSVMFVFLGIGLLFGRKSIKGTCRGNSDAGGCDVCSSGADPCVKKESPFLRPLRAFLGSGRGEEEADHPQ